MWQVAWSHPSFGSLLASCSYDRKVCIWQEVQKNQWKKIHEDAQHSASVNAVAWAPREFGRTLAAASADGTVSVYTFKTNKWERVCFEAHKGGVNAVSWAPAVAPGSLARAGGAGQRPGAQPRPRFVTGGCDKSVCVWGFNEMKNCWEMEKVLKKGNVTHKAWVRDVAWAPSLGIPGNTIASCAEDKTVYVWKEGKAGVFVPTKLKDFKEKVWRVSWSTMGNILAVSEGNNKVSLWKEAVDGKWQNLADCDEGLPKQVDGKAARN